ncbi:nitrate- and nitrite sensing domain-containing protein [Frankia sp. Mgl5]|uniref:sensor histidine kinase n=1 Tax=Frankia sp. Mgl5 TaxID=2933793 RepID=UPI00200F8F78|nr:nitrate- and nitrite sensing domain-containing protein [Frankia sp. Mgl5]MCK9931522.1 nitrate- and nitrite sensing domain-containing protein [Frankia sp. Mgl5]
MTEAPELSSLEQAAPEASAAPGAQGAQGAQGTPGAPGSRADRRSRAPHRAGSGRSPRTVRPSARRRRATRLTRVARAGRRDLGGRVSDLPVRRRLLLSIAIPAAAFLSVAILGAVTWISDAASYGRGVHAATLGRDIAATVHELQMERDLAAGFVAGGRQNRPDGEQWVNRLAAQHRSVDAAVATVRGALAKASDNFGPAAGPAAQRALRSLDELPRARAATDGAGLPLGAVLNQYSTTIADLREVDRRIGPDRVDGDLGYTTTVLRDLSEVKEVESQVRAELYAVAQVGHFDTGQADALSSLLAQTDAARAAFRDVADADDRARYDRVVNGQAVLTVERISDRAVSRQHLLDLDVDPEQWFAASTTHIELLRTVESGLSQNVIDEADTLRADAWARTALIGGFIIAITLAAVLLTMAIAATMTRPLRALRDGAHDVAHERLPRIIEQLQTAGVGQVDTRIHSIGIRSKDEIGEVARTFDDLQREAVRLAAEQAVLRRSVNTLFLSLSRRSQSLIERQLALIDRLERAEENPAQLENLFRLDHLATRMRRNSENLLVLAGTGPGRRRATPVSIAAVLQAAIGEIEQYQRIQIVEVVDARITAGAVNHVVHLIAELLENAAQFSPPHRPVEVVARRSPDGGMVVSITDRGLGMPPAEIAAANERLAHPPLFDFSIAERLGLFVVARLAERHEISVRLDAASGGGVQALVALPANLLASAAVPRHGEEAGAPRGGAALAAGVRRQPLALSPNGNGPSAPASLNGHGHGHGAGAAGQVHPGVPGSLPQRPRMASFDSSERGGTTDEFNRLLELNGLTDRPAGMPADPFTQPPAAAAPLPPPAPAAPPEVPAPPAPRFPAARTPASHGLAPLPPVVPNPPVVPWFKPRGTASKAEGGTPGTAAASAAATGASAGAGGAAGESDLPPIEEVVAGRARERERAAPGPVTAGPPPPGSSVPGEPSPDSSASGSITPDPVVPDPVVPDPVGGSAAPLPPEPLPPEAPETPFTWFDRPTAGTGTPAGPPTVPPAAAFAPTPPTSLTPGFAPTPATPADPTTSMPAGALPTRPTRPAAAPLPPPVRPVVPGATDRVVRSGAGWTGAGGAASTGPMPRLQGPPEQVDPAALPTTRAGLPMRVPAAGGTRSGGTGAEHIPGPAGRGSTPGRSGWEQPAPEVRPEWIRGRLSRLYEGVNHARDTDTTDTTDARTTDSRGLRGPGASPPVVPPGATRAERPFGSPLDRLEDE